MVENTGQDLLAESTTSTLPDDRLRPTLPLGQKSPLLLLPWTQSGADGPRNEGQRGLFRSDRNILAIRCWSSV
jgi:hypothetical protein